MVDVGGVMSETATVGHPLVRARTDGDRVEGDASNSLPVFLRKRWVYEAVYAVLVLAAAALILSLVGRRSGWPLGGQFFNELISFRSTLPTSGTLTSFRCGRVPMDSGWARRCCSFTRRPSFTCQVLSTFCSGARSSPPWS